MIDLHIQTLHGDGDMSVYRLLETVKERKLTYFSILDRNHCFAYKLIEEEKYPGLIPGVKLLTSFNNTIITLIGYDVDPEKINAWYENKYNIERVNEIEKEKAEILLASLNKAGYELEEIDLRFDRLGQSIADIYKQVMISYPDFKYRNYRDFKYYAINNPKSEFHLDLSDVYDSVEENTNVIRECGGKVFLAHPFEYRRDIPELLEMVISKELDGVEVYHSSSSVLNSLKLIDFCKATHKLASIGSGFVGDEVLVPMGVHMDEELLKLDCFKWIYEREKSNE